MKSLTLFVLLGFGVLITSCNNIMIIPKGPIPTATPTYTPFVPTATRTFTYTATRTSTWTPTGSYTATWTSTTDPTPTLTFTSSPTAIPTGVFVKRINIDGSAMVSTDGRSWSADQAYSPGSYGYTGSTFIVTGICSPQGVASADFPLFNTIRYSMSFDYFIDVPQADTYHVTLYFDECFHNPGEMRTFKILAQGTQVDQFDLVPLCVAPDGTRTLLIKSYDVPVSGSLILDLGFRGLSDNALVSAIQVSGTLQAPTPTPTP